MGDPFVSHLCRPPEMGIWSQSPHHPRGSLQALPRAGRQHLVLALHPGSNAAPLVSPQEKHHLGLRCNRSDVVWKERRICFNQQRVGLQPKYTGGLQARLYPGALPGDGPNPGLHLHRADSCSVVSGQFRPGFHRGSRGGAEVIPLLSAPRSSCCGAGGSSWQNTGSIRAPGAQLRRWHERGVMLLKSVSNGC